MTKYHVDRIDCVDCIITDAYTGSLAKRHCAAPRANADVDGDITECTGRVQTESHRTTRGSTCPIWTERRAEWQWRHRWLRWFVGSRRWTTSGVYGRLEQWLARHINHCDTVDAVFIKWSTRQLCGRRGSTWYLVRPNIDHTVKLFQGLPRTPLKELTVLPKISQLDLMGHFATENGKGYVKEMGREEGRKGEGKVGEGITGEWKRESHALHLLSAWQLW